MSTPRTDDVHSATKSSSRQNVRLQVAVVPSLLQKGYKGYFDKHAISYPKTSYPMRFMRHTFPTRMVDSWMHPDYLHELSVRKNAFLERFGRGYKHVFDGPCTLSVVSISKAPLDRIDDDEVLAQFKSFVSEKPEFIDFADGIRYTMADSETAIPMLTVSLPFHAVSPKQLTFPALRKREAPFGRKQPCHRRESKGKCTPHGAKRHGCQWKDHRCRVRPEERRRRSERIHSRSSSYRRRSPSSPRRRNRRR